MKLYPDVSWLIFAGPDQEWKVTDPRVELVRDFPANNRRNRRLFADHFQVPAVAWARGADVLITVGFVPIRKCLPTAMHVLALHIVGQTQSPGFLARTLPECDDQIQLATRRPGHHKFALD